MMDMGMQQPGSAEMFQPGGEAPEMPAEFAGMRDALARLNLNELLKDTDLNELLKGKDLNGLLTGFAITDLLSDEQIRDIFGDVDPEVIGGMDRGFGGMRGGRMMQSSAEIATTDFVLTRENTGFTNIAQ